MVLLLMISLKRACSKKHCWVPSPLLLHYVSCSLKTTKERGLEAQLTDQPLTALVEAPHSVPAPTLGSPQQPLTPVSGGAMPVVSVDAQCTEHTHRHGIYIVFKSLRKYQNKTVERKNNSKHMVMQCFKTSSNVIL